MRISDALVGAALLALTGCANPFSGADEVTRKVALSDGLVIEGASGWCVDQRSSRTRGDVAVVVFGSCAALAQDPLGARPEVAGLVTVTIDAPGAPLPPPAALEAHLSTAPGRASLARDGDAGRVDLLEMRSDEDRLVLRMRDDSPAAAQTPISWRGLFGLRGRMVSVSLFGLAEDPLEADEGFDALEAQIDHLIAVNAG
ncbi:MAG: hypothetical protein OIF48_18795 [Silicimonas sp.]|nr:hypothetical protein [Silicimonas sp.]